LFNNFRGARKVELTAAVPASPVYFCCLYYFVSPADWTFRRAIVVAGAAYRVGEHFVGYIDFLELFCRLRVFIDVWMPYLGKFAVCASDFVLRSVLAYFKDFVIPI